MRLGIAVSQLDPWNFFQDIYEDLKAHHEVDEFRFQPIKSPVFYERINRKYLNYKLNNFIKANDVVFFEWASGLLAAASQLRKQSGIVTRLHRYEMYQWVDKINWEAVDMIILVSQAKKREFSKRFPEQSENIVVIPEAININRFKPKPRMFNGDIGILCHLTPRKRVYELILSFYELTKLHDGLHLHIGGGEQESFGDYHLAIQDLIANLNLEDEITLYSDITEPEIWYHNIDIFISNSYSEGLQVAPMEAMASGCYCLSHHWAGADELLPTENLFYTDRELNEKILNYCDVSEAQKQNQRERMRAIVRKKFDIEDVKVRIREIIEEVGVKYN